MVRETTSLGGSVGFSEFKLSPSSSAKELVFAGFQNQLRMELYGDSISCGVGAIYQKQLPTGVPLIPRHCDDTQKTLATSAFDAYAFQTSWLLKSAPIINICQPGLGVYTGANGSTGAILPRYYDRLKLSAAADPKFSWQTHNKPHLAIIALGANDSYGSKALKDLLNLSDVQFKRNFINQYKSFLKTLDSFYNSNSKENKTQFVLLVMPMGATTLKNEIKMVKDELSQDATFKTPVYYLETGSDNLSEGVCGHSNFSVHQQIKNHLINFINNLQLD